MSQYNYLFPDETPEDEHRAILLTPKDHPLYWVDNPEGTQPMRIDHQYDCFACAHFQIEGRQTEITQNAMQIAHELSCFGEQNVYSLGALLGLPVQRVLGEALAELEDGRFVATCNCD